MVNKYIAVVTVVNEMGDTNVSVARTQLCTCTVCLFSFSVSQTLIQSTSVTQKQV